MPFDCSKMSGTDTASRLATRIGLFSLLLTFPAVSPLAGQGQLLEAKLEAALEQDPAQAEIRIRYRLRPAAGDSVVPVAVLPVAGVQLIESTVTVAGRDPTPLVLAAGPGRTATRLEGSVELPALAAGRAVTFDVHYRVIGPSSQPAFPRRVELPVVAVLWPPAEAAPGMFQGTVSVHPGLSVRDAFPADLARTSEADGESSGRLHRFDLPVAPSLLAFTLYTGSTGAGLDMLLDVAALAAVLLFGLIGWRRFRAEM